MKRSEVVNKIIEDSITYLNEYLKDIKAHALTYGWTDREQAYVTAIIYGIIRYFEDDAGLRQVYVESGKYILDDVHLLAFNEARDSLGERILHKVVETMGLESVFLLSSWLNDGFIRDNIIGTYELCAFEKKHEGECLKLEDD